MRTKWKLTVEVAERASLALRFPYGTMDMVLSLNVAEIHLRRAARSASDF